MSKTGIIIQARLGSTRMPWKVVKPFYQGRSILDIQINHLKEAFPEIPLVLATSVNSENDPLIQVADNLEVELFRGSENDVLDRFIKAADHFDFDRVVRICSDNPLLYVQSINELIHSEADYAAFSLADGTPTIKTHYGFWPEIVSVGALKKAAILTNDSFYHEHVTNFIYTHPEEFRLKLKPIPEVIEQEKSIRTTIDTPEDFDNIANLYTHLVEAECPMDPTAITNFIVENPGYMTKMQEQIEKNSK